MYLQRDAQFLLNNEITCAIPFYLHHSRSWATSWPSLYNFPLKRTPTIFLNFDTSSINSPYFAPFSFVQVSSCKLETVFKRNHTHASCTRPNGLSNLVGLWKFSRAYFSQIALETPDYQFKLQQKNDFNEFHLKWMKRLRA